MAAIVGNFIALGFVSFVIYWFWLAKPKGHKARAKEVVDVEMDNGVFDPAVVEVAVNTPLMLRFIRKDPSPCAEQVVFKELDIAKPLNLNEPEQVELKLDKPGEYHFSCQMGMYQGRILVS